MQKSKIQFKIQNLLFERSRELFSYKLLDSSANGGLTRRINVFLLIMGFVIFFTNTQTSFAHVLKIDGSIGITTHIDPDDEPVAKKEHTIFVTIKDADKKFDEKNPIGCDCVLQTVKDGKIVATLPITTGSTYNALRYTFPTNGTYQLRVIGEPNGKVAQFQPFDTSVEYYVKSSDSARVDKQSVLFIYFPYLVLVGVGIILFMFLNPFVKR